MAERRRRKLGRRRTRASAGSVHPTRFLDRDAPPHAATAAAQKTLQQLKNEGDKSSRRDRKLEQELEALRQEQQQADDNKMDTSEWEEQVERFREDIEGHEATIGRLQNEVRTLEETLEAERASTDQRIATAVEQALDAFERGASMRARPSACQRPVPPLPPPRVNGRRAAEG